ncbi:MAG: hypothetical protein HKN26_00385, partial [Acidimicrobiales bacterium]|nr:hypothetical protein [Acidimicrobiales bacterium]
MRLRATLALLSVPLLALAACSSDANVVTGSTAPTTEAPTSTTTPATTVTGLGLPPGTRFTIDETRPDVPVLVMSR